MTAVEIELFEYPSVYAGMLMMDSFAMMPAAGLSYLHMDPEGPTPGIVGHTMLETLDDAAIDALLAVAGPGSGSPLLAAELRHLGGVGAVARELGLPQLAEAAVDPALFYTEEAYARLRRVKGEIDPEGRFRGNHAIKAA